MHEANESIVVNATPDQVWQVLSNLHRLPEWYVPAQHIRILTDGPVNQGWQFVLAVKTMPGIVLDALGTVTHFDGATRSITWRGQTTGIAGDSQWQVNETGDGRAMIEHAFAGSGWLMFLSQKSGRNRMTVRQRLANLKALVEQETIKLQ